MFFVKRHPPLFQNSSRNGPHPPKFKDPTKARLTPCSQSRLNCSSTTSTCPRTALRAAPRAGGPARPGSRMWSACGVRSGEHTSRRESRNKAKGRLMSTCAEFIDTATRGGRKAFFSAFSPGGGGGRAAPAARALFYDCSPHSHVAMIRSLPYRMKV